MNLIEIFNVQGQEQVTQSGGCASCSSGCAPVNNSLPETVADFNERYGDSGAIVRYVLTDTNLDQIAERLQELYHNSGEQLIITGSNVKFILGKLNPIIAINGLLAANNYVPDADELKFAADNDGTIHSSICG